jgi:hypothetical protein
VVIEDKNGEIIGFCGFWIRPVKTDKGLIHPHLIVDVMVDSKYRRTQASKLIIDYTSKLAAASPIYGFPNRLSHSFFVKSFKDHKLVDQATPALETVVNIGTLVNSPWPIRPILNGVSRSAQKMRYISAKKNGVEVVQDNQIEDDFDLLWESVSKDYSWVQHRGKDYLQWRYLRAPGSKYQVWKALEQGKLVGYLISNTTHNQRAKKGLLVDCFVPIKRPDIFSRLIKTACRWLIEQGVDSMEAWLPIYPDQWKKQLKSHWFLMERQERSFVFIDTLQGDFITDLSDSMSLHKMLVAVGDSDYMGWASKKDLEARDRRHDNPKSQG